MRNEKDTPDCLKDEKELHRALRNACDIKFGHLSSTFLCQSVAILNPRAPVCVPGDTDLASVVKLMIDRKIGCIVVTDSQRRVQGIFTDRDCVTKVATSNHPSNTPISTLMTANPVCERMDATIGFALGLMSHGGFRHIPIVDGEESAIGIISVKDVVDFLVAEMVERLLEFESQY